MVKKSIFGSGIRIRDEHPVIFPRAKKQFFGLKSVGLGSVEVSDSVK
jgi:hypothetical protein